MPVPLAVFPPSISHIFLSLAIGFSLYKSTPPPIFHHHSVLYLYNHIPPPLRLDLVIFSSPHHLACVSIAAPTFLSPLSLLSNATVFLHPLSRPNNRNKGEWAPEAMGGYIARQYKYQKTTPHREQGGAVERGSTTAHLLRWKKMGGVWWKTAETQGVCGEVINTVSLCHR